VTDGVVQALLDAVDTGTTIMHHDQLGRRWHDRSALDGLTVGGLANHLYGALRRTELVLDDDPPPGATVVGAAEFYGANRVESRADLAEGIHPLIRQDAERRAEAGAEALVAKYDRLLDRLRQRLPGEDLQRLVAVVQVRNGVTPLRTYLVTRIVEAVVHTDDLAVSLGVDPPTPPPVAVASAVELFTELARARSGDIAVVRAFTRRERADSDVLRVL
jgi:uncharacterized protein (TIGR03083 family)